MSRETCERCGEDLPRLEITKFGDRERQYVMVPCGCPPDPVACCTFCTFPVDANGCCVHLGCFFVGQVVVEPIMLRYAR